MATSRDSVIQLFDAFRVELDDYNDRRERLIKTSRDITNLSKRTIFLLHRIAMEDDSSGDQSAAVRAAMRGREKLREVQELYAGMRHELGGDHFWRYQRQISPGLQEYIEALSFAHYLEHGTLITFNEIQESLCDPSSRAPFFPLTVSDYLLGVSDLTGELMRFAISGIARRGGRTKASQVCTFVRGCKADFERMTPYINDLAKKQSVTAQSLEKIENAAYAIAVRSSEYDLPQDMLDDLVARSISTFSSTTSGHGDWRGISGHRREYDNDHDFDVNM